MASERPLWCPGLPARPRPAQPRPWELMKPVLGRDWCPSTVQAARPARTPRKRAPAPTLRAPCSTCRPPAVVSIQRPCTALPAAPHAHCPGHRHREGLTEEQEGLGAPARPPQAQVDDAVAVVGGQHAEALHPLHWTGGAQSHLTPPPTRGGVGALEGLGVPHPHPEPGRQDCTSRALGRTGSGAAMGLSRASTRPSVFQGAKGPLGQCRRASCPASVGSSPWTAPAPPGPAFFPSPHTHRGSGTRPSSCPSSGPPCVTGTPETCGG